jgi:hypothetical protein
MAVLPLQRLGLPLSALVVGSVAPDAPVYLPVGLSYRLTHSGPGIAVDVVIGLALLWLWNALLRDAVVDLTSPLRERAPAQGRLGRRAWLLAPLGLAVGAATHVLWDSATHDWGFVVRGLPALQADAGPFPVYTWLQIGSTIVGSVVMVAYGVLRLRRSTPATRPAAVRHPSLWLAVVPVTALVTGFLLRDPWAGVGGAFVALTVVAILWRASTAVRRRRPPG